MKIETKCPLFIVLYAIAYTAYTLIRTGQKSIKDNSIKIIVYTFTTTIYNINISMNPIVQVIIGTAIKVLKSMRQPKSDTELPNKL